MKRCGISIIALLLLGGAARAGEMLAVTETPVGRLSLPVLPESLIISPDSSRMSFATKAGIITLQDKGIFENAQGVPIADAPSQPGIPRNIRATVMLYIDDKSTAPFEVLTPVIFSPDSKHVGFGGQKAGKWQVVVNNRTLTQEADSLPAAPIAFSPDSSRTAWVMEKDGNYIVTVDGKAWPPIDSTGVGMLSFSPDSKRLAVLARIKACWVLYVDGVALPTPVPATVTASTTRAAARARDLDRFAEFHWRPDSSGLGFYAAFTGERWQVFSQSLDGTFTYTSKAYDALLKGSPVFSPDGTHVAFATTARNKWTVFSDTSETPPAVPFDQLQAESLRYVTPAEGGASQLLYLAQRNREWRLYVDHQPVGEGFDGITLGSFLISPDGRHYAFCGRRGGKAHIIKDGKAIATHDDAGALTFGFSPDSRHVAYAAREGGQWFACVDGVRGNVPFAGIAPYPPAFSPDSARIAFAAQGIDKIWRLVVGKDSDFQSTPVDAFLKGSRVTWREDGTIVTLAIQKKVATRVEARLP